MNMKKISVFMLTCIIMLSANVYGSTSLDGFVFSDDTTSAGQAEKKTYTMDGLNGFVFEGEPPEPKPAENIVIVPDNSVPIPAEYQESYMLLKSIGLIFDNDGTNVSAGYTRKQFAKLSASLFKAGAMDGNVFADVAQDDEYREYINAAAAAKIMNGVEGDRFNPNNALTYPQMLKVLIKAVGYEAVAEENGGYPNGYFMVANELKITKNIKAQANDKVTLEMVLRAVFNTLNTNVYEISALGDGTKYQKSDETLLEKSFEIYKIKGIFNEIYGSNIYGDSSCTKNEICIDRIPMNYESLDMQLFGNRVLAYVRVEDDDKTVLFMKQEDSISITIRDKDLNSVDNNEVCYQSDDTEKKVHMTDDAKVIWNGAYLSTVRQFDANEIIPDSGEITFVDYDDDNQYDVLLVWSYTHYVVEDAISDINRIYFANAQKFGGMPYLELDEDEAEYITNITYQNELIPISQIKKGNVVSVAASKNKTGKKLMSINVSTENISGIVTEIQDDDFAYIDGKIYPLAFGYAKNSVDKLEVGVSAKFLLNYRNEITGIDTSVSKFEMLVGYLTSAYLTTDLNKKLEMQILSSKGEWFEYKCDDSVTVSITQSLSGISEAVYKTAQFDMLETFIKNRIGKTGVLIGYKLKNDEISEIYFSDDLSKASGYPGLNKQYFSLDYSMSGDTSVRLYDGTIGSRMFADAKTKVFLVPNDLSGGVEKKLYKVGTTQLFDTPNDIYLENVKMYEVGADRNVGYIVQELDTISGDTVNLSETMVVINKVVKTVNADNESVFQIQGMKAGNPYKVNTSADYGNVPVVNTEDKWYRENLSAAALKEGDVIQCTLDNAGDVVNFRLLYRIGDSFFEKWDKNEIITPDTKMSLLHTGFGIVTEKSGNCLVVNCKDASDATYEKAYRVLNTNLYSIKFSDDTPVIKKAKLVDIGVGDKVFIKSWWNVTKEILVVRD